MRGGGGGDVASTIRGIHEVRHRKGSAENKLTLDERYKDIVIVWFFCIDSTTINCRIKIVFMGVYGFWH